MKKKYKPFVKHIFEVDSQGNPPRSLFLTENLVGAAYDISLQLAKIVYDVPSLN